MNMTNRILTIEEIKLKITPVLIKHGVVKSAIFGSVARGEATAKSDVDILIDFKKNNNKTLFDMVHIQDDLQAVLNKKVDVLTSGAIRPTIRKYIEDDIIEIYDQKTR